jgi:hypothetical protein
VAGFEFDRDVLARAINDAMEVRAGELQAVYDRVHQAGMGKTIEEVKHLLRAEVRATFGTEITDPELSACAEVLASGRLIEVRREGAQL